MNAVGLAGAAVTLTTAVRLRVGEAANASSGTAPARAAWSELAPFETVVPELATASAA